MPTFTLDEVEPKNTWSLDEVGPATPLGKVPNFQEFSELGPTQENDEYLKGSIFGEDQGLPPDLSPKSYDVPQITSVPAEAYKPSKAMIPVESVGKMAGGVIDWATSPEGVMQQGLAASSPIGAATMLTKWAKDMVQSGAESIDSIGGRIKELIRSAISDKYISANKIGASPDLTPEKLDEHIQGFSDDIVNLVASGLGAYGAGRGAIKTGMGLFPKADLPLATREAAKSFTEPVVAKPTEVVPAEPKTFSLDEVKPAETIITPEVPNAVPVQIPNEEVLRQPQPEVELQGVGARNAQPEIPAAAQETAQGQAPQAEVVLEPKPEPVPPEVVQELDQKLVGMGGAVPEEFAPSGQSPTAMKYKLIDQERQKRGLDPLTKPEGLSDQAAWDKALSAIDHNPELPDELVQSILDKPRVIEDWENHVLLAHKIALRDAYHKSAREAIQAFEDSKQFPNRRADMVEANARTAGLMDKLDEVERASRASGSARGRALRSLRVMADEDFSLAEMEQQMRSARGGKPITDTERAELREIADNYKKSAEDLQTHLAQRDQKIRQMEADAALAEVSKVPRVKKALTETPEAKRGALVDAIEKTAKEGKKDALPFIVRKLARELYESGITEREAMVDALHGLISKAIPDISRREVMDMFSGYGDYKQLTKDQISLALRGMKGELQQLAKLEDMAAGQPPLKSGLERRTPTDAERQLIKEVNDAKHKFQVPVQDPTTQLKSALDTLKTALRNRTIDYQERLDRGDFATRPRREIVMDAEANRLKAKAEEVKKKFQRQVAIERWKSRQNVERAGDWIATWRRGFVLSSPVTLAKLTAAAIQRVAFTPLEEMVGAGIGKAFPKLAGKAAREGGINSSAEAKAITQGITQGMKDAWNTLKTGHSDLDTLYGKEALLPPSVVDFFGHVHGALKAPVKRAEFARSLEKRTAAAIRSGVDVTDPLIQSNLVIEAYKDANRSIFQQDNRVVTAYKRGLQALEAKNKETGKVPVAGKALATTARVLLPIVKIPTNIVAETLQYATGLVTGSARLGRAYAKGIENLKPEEADLIMRSLKKGSLGAAVFMVGYFNSDKIGGYYQPGKKRKEGDVKYGQIRLGGVDIPNWALHNPLTETLQIGATVRRVAESKLHKKDKEQQGIINGLYASSVGLLEEVPFVRQMTELVKAMNPREKDAFFGELTKSIAIPQFMQWTAQQMDKNEKGEVIKRSPETTWQHIETGIPGLRQNVPKKKSGTFSFKL